MRPKRLKNLRFSQRLYWGNLEATLTAEEGRECEWSSGKVALLQQMGQLIFFLNDDLAEVFNVI